MSRLPLRHRFGRFEVRPLERRLLVDGQPAAVGARAFDLLLALIEHRERMLSKCELLELVWPRVIVEEGNLQVQVSALRKILGPDVIATIPRRGYRFAAALIDVPGETQALYASAHNPTPESEVHLPAVVLPPLIAREHDLAELGSVIDRQRLITIVGAGGVGKSRVAQCLAHERRASFAHGIARVDLSTLSDPTRVVGSIAATLGLQLGGVDPLESLLKSIRSLVVLLVLDNAEHLIDEVARIAQAIHASAAGAHLLVTSQAPLRLAAESVYRLEALAVPNAPVSADEAIGYGAVALFVQCAQAADRRFALGEHNVANTVELCRRLDGVPLAIELAAARVPLMGLARLGAALDDRFRLLKSMSRDVAPRHRTLRIALERSYALLGQTEQAVFRRLSVFSGSFSMELAQQVATDDELDGWAVVDALGVLTERSLVSIDAQDPPRYSLLDTPRAFAQEQLAASDETASIRHRHALALHSRLELAGRAAPLPAAVKRLERFAGDPPHSRQPRREQFNMPGERLIFTRPAIGFGSRAPLTGRLAALSPSEG